MYTHSKRLQEATQNHTEIMFKWRRLGINWQAEIYPIDWDPLFRPTVSVNIINLLLIGMIK